MKRMRQTRKGQEGFLLISFYMVLAILLTLVSALAVQGMTEIGSTARFHGGGQAFYLAEGALDQGFRWLQTQAFPPGGTAPFVINGGWQNLGNSGQMMVVIDPDDDNPLNYIKRYEVTGWGASGDPANPLMVRQTNLVVEAENFARYAYFSDNERSPAGSTVWFTSNDNIRGPTHTNGQLSIYGSPTFDGEVTSGASTINYYNPAPPGGNNPTFNDGIELGASQKNYPNQMPPSLVNAANAGGRVFQGNTSITLLSDGNMQVTNAAQGMLNEVVPLPANGVVYVDGNANLQGTLSGQLTVATSGNVKIPNSITYADSPVLNPNSSDMLGIVSGGNVMIPQSSPNNVTVHATIMALNTSFGLENYWQGPPKGTLSILGGLIQAKRGPVGTFNGGTGQKVSGFSKDYQYDQRLKSRIPPFFPMTGDYNVLGWSDESVQ